MKAYKIEVLVLDCESVGEESIKTQIENSKYINAKVMSSVSRNVNWNDDHPLNKCGTIARAYTDLFAK